MLRQSDLQRQLRSVSKAFAPALSIEVRAPEFPVIGSGVQVCTLTHNDDFCDAGVSSQLEYLQRKE